MIKSHQPRWMVLPVLLAGGCLGNFKTPSAYESQVYYCDDANTPAFESLARSCTAGHTCAGAFSMKGTMQGAPLTVGATLDQATATVVQSDSMSSAFWDIIRMTGSSPYFTFVFHLKSIGGDVSANSRKTVQLHSGAGVLPDSLGDDLAEVGQTLQVGGENTELVGLTDSGTVNFAFLSKTEARGTFHGNFGAATDTVDGCFIMYPSQIFTNPSPTR
jgi:hypothetical protein